MQTTSKNTIQTIGSRSDKIEMTIRNAENLFIFTGVGPDGTKYKTAYKCEGEKLTISCAADQTIKVIIGMMIMIVIIVMMMMIILIMIIVMMIIMIVINITFSGSLNIFQICSFKGDPSKLWSFLDRDLQSARDDRHERQLHVPVQQPGHEEKVSNHHH